MSDKTMRQGMTDETFWTIKALRNYRKRLVQIREDRERKVRAQRGLCHVCYYLRRGAVVGQGFTEYQCKQCGKPHMHENTGVPKLCRKCAEQSGRCRQCAADLDVVEKEAKQDAVL
jgi:hypothetical protein